MSLSGYQRPRPSPGGICLTALFILAAATADPALLNTLFAAIRPGLFAIALSKLRNDRAAAEDVVQETLLRLFRTIPSTFDARRGSGWGFCLLVLRSTLIDWLRKERRHVRFPLDDADLIATDEDLEIRLAEEIDHLHAAIAKLPPDLERVVSCRLSGMTYDQAANATGVSLSAAYLRTQRAMSQLRDSLAE